MEEIEFSRWLFEGRLRQGKNGLPDGLNWLCYFAGSSKSHHENSISFIFLLSPHQVDMKMLSNTPKTFGYFNILETHSDHSNAQGNIHPAHSRLGKNIHICIAYLYTWSCFLLEAMVNYKLGSI